MVGFIVHFSVLIAFTIGIDYCLLITQWKCFIDYKKEHKSYEALAVNCVQHDTCIDSLALHWLSSNTVKDEDVCM